MSILNRHQMVFVPNMPHVLVCFVRRQMSLYALEGEGGGNNQTGHKNNKGLLHFNFWALK